MKQTRGVGSTQRRKEARRFFADEARSQQDPAANEQLWEEHRQHLEGIAQHEAQTQEDTQRYVYLTQSMRELEGSANFQLMTQESLYNQAMNEHREVVQQLEHTKQKVHQCSNCISMERYNVEILRKHLHSAEATLQAEEGSYTQQRARVAQLQEELNVRNSEVASLRAETQAEQNSADDLEQDVADRKLTLQLAAAIQRVASEDK